MWLFPTKIAEDKHWIPVVAVLGTTAGLVALDPIEAHYFRNASTYSGFNKVFSSNATAVGTVVGPLALYGAGLIRHDSKMQKTALFAGEAAADAELLTTVFKSVDKRLRPVDIPRNGIFLIRGDIVPHGQTAAFPQATALQRLRSRQSLPGAITPTGGFLTRPTV